VSLDEIAKKNDYNLNISRYVSTAVAEEEIDLPAVNAKLIDLEKSVKDAKDAHNTYLKELGLPELP
jgi:type I restriction enzyme M protein